MGAMAYGLWRARYWAVLGFQAVARSLGLASSARSTARALIAARARHFMSRLADPANARRSIAIAGTLFYFMVKAHGPHPDARARAARVAT